MRKPLSFDFDMSQYTYSDTANVKGFLEQFQVNESQVEKMEAIHHNVVAILLLKLVKGDLYCSSGYRCERLNKAVGGQSTSQHTKCEAVDLEYYVNGIERNDLLFEACKELPDFDQLIKEKGTENNPAWIHVSFVNSKSNRKQILTIKK